MSNLRQAAQQALEVLEALQGGCTDHDDGTVEAITVWCPEIIEDLRAALAEPEQEPVAWWIPKYKAPDMVSKVRWSDDCEPLYTTPRQRRPLTDAQHDALMKCKSTLDYGRAVEAAHGIKEQEHE